MIWMRRPGYKKPGGETGSPPGLSFVLERGKLRVLWEGAKAYRPFFPPFFAADFFLAGAFFADFFFAGIEYPPFHSA